MDKNSMTVEQRLEALETALLSATIRSKEILTFEEACNFLNISHSWLYKMTSSKSIPFYKPAGRYLYFERAELEKWIRSAPVKTEEQLDDEALKYCYTNEAHV